MSIEQIIKNRKTQKILANQPWQHSSSREQNHQVINDLLSLVEYAPYYKKCHKFYSQLEHEMNSCVPWRIYVLDTAKCRDLYNFIEREEIKAGKISNMLAAADALFFVNWLPNLSDTNPEDFPIENPIQEPFPFAGSEENMDHIASCSAAIQNILIGATAKNLPNYWSSGGKLREKEIRDYLEIPMREILLGAVFIFPEDSPERASNIRYGQFRNQGKERSSWSKWLK